MRPVLYLWLLLLGVHASAQTVQPVIVEYKGKASGQFTLTNNTLQPMIVVLEPKSFSITPEGRGIFRPLDPGIHLQLSSQSVRLEPQQNYHVFYKADADALPAWFTIYASFSPVRRGPSLEVRILLPHTVYLYQKQPVTQNQIDVRSVVYNPKTKMLECDVEASGGELSRVLEVRATGPHHSVSGSGFPLLPQNLRHVQIAWTASEQPDNIVLRFEHFTITHPVKLSDE
jgi:hypothetical protein